MPKRKQTEPPKSASESPANGQSDVTSAAKFQYREIPRSQINPAPYNPRSLSAYARKQLATSIERYGLVEPLVWNKRTGVLISGHQRLSILDQKEGYPAKDYRVPVAVVDLTEKKEKELNVWLNNRAAQGNFDKESLAQLLSGPDITLDDFGFTAVDLEFEFGGIEGFESVFERQAAAIDPIKKDVQAIKDRKKEVRGNDADNNNAREDADYYLMEVFDSGTAKEDFLRQAGFPNGARFLSHREREAVSMMAGASSDAKATIDRAVQQIRDSEQTPDMPYWRALELIAADWLS